jgi:hypothetical protein
VCIFCERVLRSDDGAVTLASFPTSARERTYSAYACKLPPDR